MDNQSDTRTPPKYFVSGPAGDEIEIPQALFRALHRFLGQNKPTGRIEIDCKNGGVAQVRAMEVFR